MVNNISVRMLDLGGSSLQRSSQHPAYPTLKRHPHSRAIPATSHKDYSSIESTFSLSSRRKILCYYISTHGKQLLDVHHRTLQWLPRYKSVEGMPRASRDNGSSSASDSAPNVTSSDTSRSPLSAPVQSNSQRGRSSMEHLQQQARAKLADLVKQQLEEEQRERLKSVSLNPPQPSSTKGSSRTTNDTLTDTVISKANNSTKTRAMESTSSTFASDGALPTSIVDQREEPKQGPRAHEVAAAATAATSTSTSFNAAVASTFTGESGTLAGVGSGDNGNTASYDPQSEWAALRAELAEDWRRVEERWSRFLSRPLDPPPLSPWQQQQQQLQQQASLPSLMSGTPGPSSSPDRHTMTSSPESPTAPQSWPQASSKDGNSSSVNSGTLPDAWSGDDAAASATSSDATTPVQRRRPGTPISWLLLATLVATFAAQWAPLVQRLAADGWPAGQELTMGLAVLLACPPTPLTLSWQADAITAAAGDWVCLLTSSLLHSGLISLMAALSSLQETAPWLESLHGFMIMIISYSMASLGASLGQLCVAGQTTGLAGLGAAVGMEAAACVRYWRATGRPQPPTLACLLLLIVAGVSAAYQPLVGTWGILGGLLGGALSGVLAYDVLYGMRVVVALSILAGLAVWNVVTWVPRQIWRMVVLVATAVWGTAGALVAAIRAL